MVSWIVRAGGVAGGMILSQNKVLQRFVEQTIDDLVLDRVQQRFEEEDLETPRVSLVQSGVGLVAPFSNVDIISTSFSTGRHLPSCRRCN